MKEDNTYDYDAQVRAIQAYNQPILDGFRAWLEQSGLAEKTIKNHVDNIDFFTDYLVYYEPLENLDEADGSDVWMFLTDWFPKPRVVGLRHQCKVLFSFIQEILPVDGRDRSRLSRNSR
jgi:hypothetical protein